MSRLLWLLLALLPFPAAAQTLDGAWALRLEGSIIMRWDLEREGEAWSGAWTRPDSFASDGRRFGSIRMPAVESEADSGRAIGEWAELTFNGDDEDGDADVFRFRLLSEDRAEMIYAGTGLPPFTLERVAEGALLGPFTEGRVYGGEPGSPRPAGASSTPISERKPPTPPPARQAPPPEDEPAQGPPAMVGR